jgi:hypothetical protein
LTVALVEFAAPGAGDVRDQPVEDLSAVFVEVQSLVHELAQEPSALRAAMPVGKVQATGGRIVGRGGVAQPAHAVARGQQPGAHDRANARGVHDLVPLAGLETALEPDERVVSHGLPTLVAGETPALARDGGPRAHARVADGEHGRGLVHVGGRIRLVRVWLTTGRRVQRPVRQQVVRVGLIRLKGDRDPALDGLAVRVERLGRLEAHQAGLALDVPLPAAHGHRPAPPHQEAVADVDVVGRRQRRQPRREPIERHPDPQATVHDEVQQAPIGPPRVGRLQQDEIRPEPDPSAVVARRFVEVDNALVRRVRGIDGEMQPAVDALVVERERTATGDLEMRNSHTG